jgi:hypothetical protein
VNIHDQMIHEIERLRAIEEAAREWLAHVDPMGNMHQLHVAGLVDEATANLERTLRDNPAPSVQP